MILVDRMRDLVIDRRFHFSKQLGNALVIGIDIGVGVGLGVRDSQLSRFVWTIRHYLFAICTPGASQIHT